MPSLHLSIDIYSLIEETANLGHDVRPLIGKKLKALGILGNIEANLY